MPEYRITVAPDTVAYADGENHKLETRGGGGLGLYAADGTLVGGLGVHVRIHR